MSMVRVASLSAILPVVGLLACAPDRGGRISSRSDTPPVAVAPERPGRVIQALSHFSQLCEKLTADSFRQAADRNGYGSLPVEQSRTVPPGLQVRYFEGLSRYRAIFTAGPPSICEFGVHGIEPTTLAPLFDGMVQGLKEKGFQVGAKQTQPGGPGYGYRIIEPNGRIVDLHVLAASGPTDPIRSSIFARASQ